MHKIYLLAVSLFVAVVFWSSTAMGYSVYPGVDEITVEPENYFEISYYFGGLGTDHGGLKAWYIDIVWDNSLVEIENPTMGGDITFHGWDIPQVIPPHVDHGSYSIGLTAFQMFTPSKTGEDIALATIRYHCLGPGQTIIYPRPHFELMGTDFKGSVNNITLDEFVTFDVITEINQVPIPSTLLLLGTGFVGIMGLRRRK